MADEFNIILEHLRALRADSADLKEGLGRVETRLTSVERHMVNLHGDVTESRADMDKLRARIERIEKRLDLHDPAEH